MGIKIEDGIPTPEENRKYPWHEMEVGQSFLVTGGPRCVMALRAALHSFNRHNKTKRFISRAVDDGVRVWRVT